jgi:hypothetical protein
MLVFISRILAQVVMSYKTAKTELSEKIAD